LYFAWDVSTDTYYISVWDIPADKELFRFHPSWTWDSYPANWSSDGQEVIIYDGPFDKGSLLSLHVNGEIETLLPEGMGSPQFALSPDDNKLAFWLTDEKRNN
jgi:dipeptidyl aminopeptidase/acylaminoacyl peptidase